MPLALKWSYFDKGTVSREGDEYGVYELGNEYDILYIGEGHVYSRLMAHFPGGRDPIVGASGYRVEYTGSKARAEQRQNAELAEYRRTHGRLPRFNGRRS